MKQAFSTKWKSSKSPAKQRKYRYNLPLHLSRKFLSAHLSSDLRKKHSKRSITVVKGDKVKVLRGQFKGRENKVERVDHKNLKVYITGIDRAKKDGSKSMYPFNPTNIMITELNLTDKKRKASLEKKGGNAKPSPEQKAAPPTAAAPAEKSDKGN